MIFVKHGLIISRINFKILHRNFIEIAGFIFQRANSFISGITINWSEKKRIMLVCISHVIKIIDIISPNRFSNISSYINKVAIKRISYVPRIHMDNIIMNYLLYSIFYLTIFCVNDVIDDTPSSLYIAFFSIEFMFIINL